MSDTALSAEISDTFRAINEEPGIGAADATERTIAEVEGVIGAYRSPEQIAAEEAAVVRADEARAAEYRQPATITPEKLGAVLKADRRSVVAAHHLGEHGLASASSALSAIPKDVVAVMDGVGMFGSARSWQLMADLGSALQRQGSRPDHPEAAELTADGIAEALGDRLDGLPSDAAESLAVLLNGLPVNVRAALDDLADDDPDLLELGVALGRKLWGYAPPSTRKVETMTTTRRPPANADDLVRQAKKLQASQAYHDTGDPDHQKVRATVRRIYQAAYPQPKEEGQ